MSRIHKMCVQLISIIQKRKIIMLSRHQCRAIIPRHHYRRAFVTGTVGPDGFPDEAPVFLKSNDVISMQNIIKWELLDVNFIGRGYCSGCHYHGVMLCCLIIPRESLKELTPALTHIPKQIISATTAGKMHVREI